MPTIRATFYMLETHVVDATDWASAYGCKAWCKQLAVGLELPILHIGCFLVGLFWVGTRQE